MLRVFRIRWRLRRFFRRLRWVLFPEPPIHLPEAEEECERAMQHTPEHKAGRAPW